MNPRKRKPLRIPAMDWPEPSRRAADLFADLHWGIKPRKLARVRTPHVGHTLTELGRLESIDYSTNKSGDGMSRYTHEFGEDGGRKPTLAVDPETRDLHIVGGSYTVERAGIID